VQALILRLSRPRIDGAIPRGKIRSRRHPTVRHYVTSGPGPTSEGIYNMYRLLPMWVCRVAG
jgi:hypothetical protein